MKVAVACGGTGGHVFPGLATARELLSRGHEVTLWMTGRETEQSALRDWDGPVVQVPARGFPSGISLRSLQTAWKLAQAVRQCRKRMRQDRPDVLLAMGSYASVGPCAAARLLGVPIVLHEANVIPGRAVKPVLADRRRGGGGLRGNPLSSAPGEAGGGRHSAARPN
jgi:UDP-N-acetylglucosamine--N-acetylmuramyl-(pentapeptide) pyrophosphoryl-undecaprenol N-acetylglucosamine transferase